MEGYLSLRIAPWLRRIITRLLAVIPAILVITLLGESATGDMLVLSQVILSMQLGFAIIPLLHFVSDRRRMGEFTIGPWTKAAGWLSACIIVALNIRLVAQQISDWQAAAGAYLWVVHFVVFPVLAFSAGVLGYITLKPFLMRIPERRTHLPHNTLTDIATMVPEYKHIAVALDFSEADKKTLQHALHIGGKNSHYLLVHAVETAGALVMGADIQDYESGADRQNLELYAEQLRAWGYVCETAIGFGPAIRAIPKVVNEKEVNLLVMGAHGHKTLKDLIFGTTIGAVRHAVKIPVLIVQ
jgi:manganese transport protein